MTPAKEVVVITGSSGFIGRALADEPRGSVHGCRPRFCRPGAGHRLRDAPHDLSSEDSVCDVLKQLRARHGARIASVIHLAGYYDLSGEPSPKYEAITVRGTERLLRWLEPFDVGEFVFASTILVHAPCSPGKRIASEAAVDSRGRSDFGRVLDRLILEAVDDAFRHGFPHARIG